jgi:hypothetical protein
MTCTCSEYKVEQYSKIQGNVIVDVGVLKKHVDTILVYIYFIFNHGFNVEYNLVVTFYNFMTVYFIM